MNNKLFKIFLSMTAIYAILIFYLSSQTELSHIKSIGSDVVHLIIGIINDFEMDFIYKSIINTNSDKLGHIGIYFGFGLLLYFMFKYYRNPTLQRYPASLAVISGIAYGALDEIHQYFVPGRSASATDLMADTVGLVLAQCFILMLFILRDRIKQLVFST